MSSAQLLYINLLNLTVNQNKYPLRFNVGFLINQPVGAYRDLSFEVPHLGFDHEFSVNDFSGKARVGRTQQGILVQAAFNGKTQLECVRCLTEFEQKIDTRFDELYAFKYKGVSESGLILPEDANINLAPLVREYLLIEMPISPLCKPDCKGLCPVCGADLNTEPCEHNVSVLSD